jgi:precorrin-6Y C5,15-methyltransferase (decarboxylating)
MSSEVSPKDAGRILVFGGTIEGRKLSDYLVSEQIPHTVSVATEYGEEVLEPNACRTVHRGRMDAAQMEAFLQSGQYLAVADATHPYAVEVSKNIRTACEKTKIPYLRYLRPQANCDDGTAWSDAAGSRLAREAAETVSSKEIWVDSMREAAEYLEGQTGTVFLTTGSKELHVFTEILTDRSRLFARVLPSAEVIASCRALGLEGRQICGMQGPFSREMNEAMLRQSKASFLVTKDTGSSGGFAEKVAAARQVGVRLVIIRRPQENGSSFEEVTKKLKELLKIQPDIVVRNDNVSSADCSSEQSELTVADSSDVTSETDKSHLIDTPQISCIGIGMGTPQTLTQEAAEAIRSADILFGARRILESVDGVWDMAHPPVRVEEYRGPQIAAYLREHPQYHRAAILMSGDVGFYSGARGIADAFSGVDVQYYCGISSVVYFASRIPTSWQDAKLLSAHGKQVNLLNCVQRYPKIIMIVSGADDVRRLCTELAEAGMEEVQVTVGNNLSYPDETVVSGHPSDFQECATTGLHIMMFENPQAHQILSPGIADEEFVRGKVPMTKEEIRILSVAKLRLREDSIIYDVGAGTGSVSVECARLATSGTVYAIEKNPEGIALIRENSRKLRVSNVIPIEGLAPQALDELPPPTHAFIGGSSGNMREIIEVLRSKNPEVRIVINTIALESIAEVMQILPQIQAQDADIVQVSAAKSRVLGRYHMMTAQNPVYIISFGGR